MVRAEELEGVRGQQLPIGEGAEADDREKAGSIKDYLAGSETV